MIYNSWAGKLAKLIMSKKHTKRFWNIFFGILLTLILIGYSVFAYKILCDYITYESEQIFLGIEDGEIITNSSTFKIPSTDQQEITIHRLSLEVQNGEKIKLFISRLNGDLMEVKYRESTVYSRIRTPVVPGIIAGILLLLPACSLIVFVLVAINSSSSNKTLLKIKKALVYNGEERR